MYGLMWQLWQNDFEKLTGKNVVAFWKNNKNSSEKIKKIKIKLSFQPCNDFFFWVSTPGIRCSKSGLSFMYSVS